MTRVVLLDTGVVGDLVRPKMPADQADWLRRILATGAIVCLPEIADYELRRELNLQDFRSSIEALDRLAKMLVYLPLTTGVMRLAAQLWAEARRKGQPTADRKALDGDVILAAQARLAHLILGARPEDVRPQVATANVGHLARFVDARAWTEI